jgi:ABC-2 type transport system ATP-binding protein
METRTARSEATRLLEQFRLTERSKAPVMALSGGMAQRLMVARAVMHRPSVLFLDEPTAGLDPQSRIAMWEILGELHVDGQTILLTTHYMEEADQLCDRVAIIDQGRVVALDTPAALKRSVGAVATVRVTADGDLDVLAAHLREQIPATTDAQVRGGAIYLGVRATDGVLPSVMQVADRQGFEVTDLSVTETTLETVFIHLTGKELRE